LLYKDTNPKGGKENVDAIFSKLGGAKYLGFPIYDIKQTPGATLTEPNNTLEVGGGRRSFAGNTHYTKTQIDAFVTFDEFKDKGDPKKCRGFSPKKVGDGLTITNATTATYDPGNSAAAPFPISADTDVEVPELDSNGNVDAAKTPQKTYKYKVLTKKCFDILDKGNTDLNGAVEVTFLHNSFDEMEGKSANEMLEIYHYVIKSNQMRGGSLYSGAANKNNRETIQKCYDIAKGMADLLDEKSADKDKYSEWVNRFNKYIRDKRNSSDAEEKSFGDW
jgi:hypothetical protein